LFGFINSRFGYHDATGGEYLQIQSVSMTDTLIYADFLPDSDAILHVPILSVLKSSLEKELLGDEDAENAQAQQPEEQEQEKEEEEVSYDTTPDDSSEEDEADLAEGEGDQDGDESEDEDEENKPAAPQPDNDDSAAPEQPVEADDNEEQEKEEEEEEEGVEQVGAEEAENQQDEPKQEHDYDASNVASSIADSSSPRDRQSAAAKEARRRLDLLSFVDFNVVCVRKRRPSNTNKSPGSRNIAEEEEEDDDEVLEDVKLPPVRVRLVRQKPLCDREILSSLFDAAEKQEQERNRRKGSREKASTATATTTTTSRSLIHQIADSVRSASLYMLAYSVQYLVIQFLLIVFFKEVYIKRRNN
jgi:hypothetical protein